MTNRSFLFMGGLLAVAGLLTAVGCGDDTDTGGSTTGGTTTATTGTGGGTTGTGTGGGTTGTGTGGGTTGTGTGGGAPDCASYCTAIMANCTAANAQYTNQADCEATCAALDLGTAADMSGNTVGCRAYHAGAASADPATHCPHAGPLGAGVCGDPCKSFCQIAVDICPAAYTSAMDCETACGLMTAGDYSTAATSGDTLACRMYHLQVASTDQATHCGHVGAVSPTCQ